MKFLRVGSLNQEKPAIIDEEGVTRDLSSVISDLNPTTVNQNTIEKIKKINLKKLPEVNNNIRIGSCVASPEKFIGIGLNYTDHAKATGMEEPKEPIIFIKANNIYIQLKKKDKFFIIFISEYLLKIKNKIIVNIFIINHYATP